LILQFRNCEDDDALSDEAKQVRLSYIYWFYNSLSTKNNIFSLNTY